MTVYVSGVGVAAPGINSWSDAFVLLRGDAAYTNAPMTAFTPTLLPANEQRRATATVRIAFRVAEEAIRNSNVAADSVATVFASSDADMMVSHRLCTALAPPQRLVSPTDFHNSVHNAPSGYWHIGARSRLPSSAIAAHDFSFAAGLLETITQVQTEQRNTLLVCYDVPAPEPLLAKRPLQAPFAIAILLTAQPTQHSMASISIALPTQTELETQMDAPELEWLRLANPAARSLPLLHALALRQSGDLNLRRTTERTLTMSLAVL